jgi:hypothetical protein
MFIKLCLVLMLIFAVSEMSTAACNNDIPKTTPDQAFTLNNNGTVTHNKTGLMWMRCLIDQTWNGTTCSGSGQTYIWQNALQSVESYSFAGYNDWRLPNKNELASIVEDACYNPAINTFVFPNALASAIWSSSRHPYDSFVWYVNFIDGRVYGDPATNMYQVRLVRGGQ